MPSEDTTVTFRLNADLKERAEKATQVMGHSIPLTSLLKRGLILACEEIEKFKEKQT